MLNRVPQNIYRIRATQQGQTSTAVMTSRDEAREHRRTLAKQGATNVEVTRHPVGDGETVNSL